jgi:hypothetical protein
MENFIDIKDDDSLRLWACRLSVSPDHLARLVTELGPWPERIRDALKREELSRSGGRRKLGG